MQKAATAELQGLAVIDGVMFQLPTSREPFRLLLVLLHPDKGVLLFTVGDSVAGSLSTAYHTAVLDERDEFREGDIRDFDGDGRADFQYCWRAADSDAEQMRIVGYGDRGWYVIKDPRFQPLQCSAGRD